KPGALPLGDAPVSYNRMLSTHFPVKFFKHLVSRRPVTTACDEALHGAWKMARDFISFAVIWKAPKHTRSSSSHSCGNKIVQQDQSVTYLWITPFHHWLTVVMAVCPEKVGHSNGRSIACQQRIGKNFCCTNRYLRRNHKKPRLGQFHWCELIADAFGKGRPTAHENRDVRSQTQPQVCQTVLIPAQLPQVIQPEQGSRRIRTAAANAATHGQALVQP